MTFQAIINFGSLALAGVAGGHTIQNISSRKVNGTLKYAINGRLVQDEIPGRADDNQISISGTLQGANRDADRNTLKSYKDGQPRRFDDGENSSDYVIVDDSLVFDDADDRKNIQRYSMTLIEYNQ